MDVWRNVSFPLLRGLAGTEALSGLSLKVLKRGSAPLVSDGCELEDYSL